jgi:hypothetical protein
MAYPPLIPISGPYGTVNVPASVGPAFGMPPEPLGPPPSFQPGELEGAILGDVPRVTEPPLPTPLPYMAPEQPLDVAPSVTRGPLPGPAPQPFIGPDETVPMAAPPAPAPQQAAAPAPGSLPSMYANIEQRKDIARRRGEAEGQAATAEADILDEANREDDRLAKERQVARDAANKELGAAKAKRDSAMDAFVNHKVDQNRLWHNMGTGSKIMAGIGIMLSGLGNALAKKGDARNPALDMIMGAIQDDVRMQLADRDKLGQVAAMRKDAVGDLRAAYNDDEAAYGAIVAGNTRRVANNVAAVAARAKDPAAKLRAEEGAALLNGEADKIAQAADERAAAARQQALENKQRASQLGLAWAGHKRGIFESDRAFAEGQRKFDLDMQKDYDLAMAAAAAKRAEGDAKAAERIEKEAKETRELAIGGFNREPLKNKDGTVFKSPDTHEAAKLRKQVTAGAEAIRIIDQIKQLREKEGATWFKTDAARQLKGNLAALQLEIKNSAELGVLAGPDMGLIESYLGTGDPTEFDTFGSIEKGLDEARNNLRSKVQRSLETANYTGTWQPPDLGKVDKTKSDADVAAQMAKDAKTTSEVAKEQGPSSLARKVYYPFGGSEDSGAVKRAEESAAAQSDFDLPGVSKEAATGLRALGALANGSDEYQADRARQNLAELATKGPTEKRLAAIEVMRNAGMTAEADAAVEKLPGGEKGSRGVRDFAKAQQSAPANDNVSGLESAARSGDGAARFRLVQMAGMPGPGQKEAGEALIRLTRTR